VGAAAVAGGKFGEGGTIAWRYCMVFQKWVVIMG